MRNQLIHLYNAFYPPIYFQGSIIELDWAIIEDVPDCITVVQGAIRDTLEYIQSSDDFWKYLMDVIRFTRLGLTFSGRSVILGSTSSASHSLFKWIPSLRPSQGDHCIVERIVKALDACEDQCISSGVSALR